MAEYEQSPNALSYGKRSLWQWILIYVVIGAILYGLIYYFVLANRGGYSGSSYTPKQNVQQNQSSGC